jgi:hypothetical protein
MPDGSLLFQPSTNGIDVFDGRLGTLRSCIALPLALSVNYDAFVADGTDNVLIAITGATGNGIAIVDLTSLSEPSPLPFGSEPATRSSYLHARNIQFGIQSIAGSNSSTGNTRPGRRHRAVPYVTQPKPGF